MGSTSPPSTLIVRPWARVIARLAWFPLARLLISVMFDALFHLIIP